MTSHELQIHYPKIFSNLLKFYFINRLTSSYFKLDDKNDVETITLFDKRTNHKVGTFRIFVNDDLYQTLGA